MEEDMRRIGVAALAAALLVGCNLDQQTAPDRRTAVGSAEHVTTGGASITFVGFEVINRLSFVAQRVETAPTAEGEFEYTGLIGSGEVGPPEGPPESIEIQDLTLVQTSGQIHGIVLCFRILGNSARVGGLITHSKDPTLINQQVFWSVTDNGEGGGALLPDMASILFLGPAEPACEVPPAADLPIQTGNVQVHAASSGLLRSRR
jgi:hypothetical protein